MRVNYYMMKLAAIVIALIEGVVAQQSTWGKCRGVGGLGSSTTQTATATTAITATFTNPVLYEDFADNDIWLGPNDTFYYSSSNMHFDPGAPILKSYDLVNWEFVGHSVPSIGVFGAQYNLTDGLNAYRQGTWASTLRYRASNQKWYWIGCIGFWVNYIYTAPAPEGPWTQSATWGGDCYYDCGLLIDDDDTMYVVYGGTNVSIAQLAPDGLSQVKTQPVFNAADTNRSGIEGNRLYKRDGIYYVLDDDTQGTTIIWKASDIWGPWTPKILQDNIASPVPGGSTVDQGSLIEDQNGNWWFMSFTWSYPLGRMPVLAPITWGSDGYPILTEVNGAWGESYPYPLPPQPIGQWLFNDTFPGPTLDVSWEWNHNPDETKYSVNHGLTLQTATVTQDLYSARNTLTHRLHGPYPVGTVAIDFTNMADGDVAGLAAFRDAMSWIGVVRNGTTYTIQMRLGATQDSNSWNTTSVGTIAATVPISGTKVWLRVAMEAAPDSQRQSWYFYSTDGVSFIQLGPTYQLDNTYYLFEGYRFGIFNFAGKALGGSVLITEFVNAAASEPPS